MLRLVLSARSRLLRAAVDAVRPRAPHLTGSADLPHRRCASPRFFSFDAGGHDSPRWTTLAVNNAEAWQEAVKPSLITFLKLKKHLMVPVMFVVPHGDEAWPRAAWGCPLGKIAVRLRKQWREGEIGPKQRAELDKMGFAWDWHQYKWDYLILPSLRRFYELNGHTDVSAHFRVPRGSPDWPEHLWDQYLGSMVKNIRHRGDFIEQVKADQGELERLNFCVGSALSSRKRREMVVPARNAPSDKCPLDELRSVWNDSEWKWSERIMPAFEAFHRLKGHCRVPVSFVVPSDEGWPMLSWGLNLGAIVEGMRSRGTYSSQVSRDRDRLVEMGFGWDFFEAEWNERIVPALETFHRLEGHCRVVITFVVPSDDNWPRLSWGLNLGTVVSKIRQGSYFTQVLRDKNRLEELGFVWDFFEAEWGERIMPALETFHLLEGHCQVPQSFVVPSDDNWPNHLWGLNLGTVIKGIRTGHYAAQVARSKTRLEALGFVWNIYETEWSERVLPALETFYQLYGHYRVPRTFKVPADASWPAESHGLNLGFPVHNIRGRGSYFDPIARTMDSLEAIEFDSKSSVTKKWEERVEPMLATFEQLHGHRDVPRDFVVPSSAPGEVKDWGIQLGKLERKEPLPRRA